VTDLVGRKLECETLVRLAEISRADGARLALVRGPGGIGKSSLMTAAGREIGTEDTTLLVATGCALVPAYGSVRELFEPLGLTAGSALLRGRAESALSVLASDGQPDDDYAVLSGLDRLALNLMEDRPLVIMLDEAHSADVQTLRWIDFLLRRCAEQPLLVVLAWQPGVVEHADLLFAELAVATPGATIDLSPLSTQDVATLVERAFGRSPDPSFARACGLITGGNPLWLHTLLTSLRVCEVRPDASGVEHARELGRQLLAGWLPDVLGEPGEHAHDVACAIALLGPTDVRMVSRFLELPEPLVASEVDALRRKEVLAAHGMEFRHEDIARVALSGLPPGKVTELRRRAGTLLNNEGRPAEEVAAQLRWLPKLPEVWMFCALREAAAAAVRRGDLDVAVGYLTQVLNQVPGHPATLLELSDVLAMMRPAEALPRLAEVADQMADTGEKAGVLCRLGMMAVAARRTEAAFDRLARFLDDGGIDGDLRLRVHAVLLTAGLDRPLSTARLLQCYRTSPGQVPNTASGRLVAGVAAQAEMLAGESLESTLALARQGLVPETVAHAGPALAAAAVLGVCGEPAEAMAALDRLITISEADGVPDIHALALATRAGVLDHAGDLTRAQADAKAALDVVERVQKPMEAALPHASMASILLKAGHIAAAEEHLNLMGEPRFGWTSGPVMIMKAAVRRARGDRAGALDLLLECGRQLTSAGIHNPVWAPWWLDAVCLLVALERRTEAAELAEFGAGCAGRWDTSEARGLALMARGMVATGEAATESLGAAVAELSASCARPLHVRAVRLLGEVRLSDGDAKAAREHLRTAVNLAIRMGDHAAAAEARDLLVLAGGRMPKLGVRPADALSGRERRVAELAAAGATNREIAEQLFVTVRTVESHLSNVYRKLGVELRADLLAALETSRRTTRA
jgi:DNA-binding CsgD family transcriptional regulator